MSTNPVTEEQKLLAAIEDVLRSMPPVEHFSRSSVEILPWLGHASAVIHQWDSARGILFNHQIRNLRSRISITANGAYSDIVTTLHEARHDLCLKTTGPMTIVVGQGGVYEYFDEVRKIIGEAKQDLLFVDAYLNADFVSRYLPLVSEGVTVRLLTNAYLDTLLPAVELFSREKKRLIEVRSIGNLHDRFVFVDQIACYQSGASFKDGAKNSPTTLTQIIDAFPAILSTYEDKWASAN